MAQSESILSNQTHVGDSSVQTHTGTGFQGAIDIQATLAITPGADDWFTVTGTNLTSTDDSGVYNTGTHIYSFTGNYVWVRAYISNWTDGSVSSVLLNH